MSDRAADLLGATSALKYLRQTRPDGSPDAQRLVDRIQGLVAELIAAQNDDGGWPWVSPSPIGPDRQPAGERGPASERFTSALVFWALAEAERLGLLPDPEGLRQGRRLAEPGDDRRRQRSRPRSPRRLARTRSARARRRVSKSANSLNRERQNLSNAALAYLALTFANLGRPELAGEVFAILGPRARPSRPPPAVAPASTGTTPTVGRRGAAETTALVCLAYATTRGQATELPQAIDWLEAHRFGAGWNPHKAKGPALAALASYHGRSKAGDARYRLAVVVNETKVAEIDVAGAAEGQVIDVPVKALKAGDSNRVAFTIEGRGTFGYAVSMTGFTREFGPDQDRNNRPAWVDRRVYWPAPRNWTARRSPSASARSSTRRRSRTSRRRWPSAARPASA